MARKKLKTTELKLFKGREAKLNHAIFETLAARGPQTKRNMQKEISKQKGLSGTYYASVSKRISALEESGYVRQVKPTQEGSSKAAVYELRAKAYLATVLNSTSFEDLLSQISDARAISVLLVLLNAILTTENSY